MRTEINHHIALADDGAQIVAGINLADDFEFAKIRRAGDERLAHAAFRAGDDDAGHSLIQHVTTFQRRAQRVPIFRIHRHERQAIFFLDQFHHRQRGLHRRRVRLDEQILEQRIKFLMNSQRRRRLAGRK